ncbi:MAG: hypothetical protein KAS32_00435 [Candidatus Peribacteraceae bacterium]|nr:hypothetical protein [Candidatus Peribacteraceae bacterium]
MTMYDEMFVKWNRLCGIFDTIGNNRREFIFNQIYTNYQEHNNRTYHNLEHIRNSLRIVNYVSNLIYRERYMLMAIWFHDIICVAGSPTNEKDSADLMRLCLGGAIDDSLIDDITELIMVTKHPLKTPIDMDHRYMLDIDLSILGSDEDEYGRYSTQIRDEYSSFTLSQYIDGRVTFLRSLLDMDHIYRTPLFRKSFERQATLNITREIRILS